MKDSHNDQPRLPVDRGWAWMVLTGSFVSLVLTAGVFKTFGILFEEFMEVYKSSATVTVIVLVGSAASRAIFAPMAGWMFDHFGSRITIALAAVLVSAGSIVSSLAQNIVIVIVFYGFIQGAGCAFSLGPSQTAVIPYFEKRRGLASGIVMAGSSVGGLIFPLVIRHLVDEYTLKGCLLIIGGIQLNFLVAASLMRPPSFYTLKSKPALETNITLSTSKENIEDTSKTLATTPSLRLRKNRRKHLNRCGIFKNYHFILILLSFAVTGFGFASQFLVLPNFALGSGCTKEMVAVLMTIFGGADFVGRLCLGMIFDLKIVDSSVILLVASLGIGAGGFVLPFFPTLGAFVTYSAGAGLLGGLSNACIVPMVISCMDEDQVSTSVGYIWLSLHASSTLSSVIIGVIRDATGTFFHPFLLGAGFYILSCLLWTIEWLGRRRLQRNIIDGDTMMDTAGEC